MFGWLGTVVDAEHAHCPLRQLRADDEVLATTLARARKLRLAHMGGLESVPACWRAHLGLIETWEQTCAEAMLFLLRPGAGDMAVHEAAERLNEASGLTRKLVPHLSTECGLLPEQARLCAEAVARAYAYLHIAREGLDSHARGLEPTAACEALTTAVLEAVCGGNTAEPGPGRILAVIHHDVLNKTRDLALAATFGPHWRHGEELLLELLRKGMECHGLEAEDCARAIALARLVLKHAKQARDPGELRERLGPLGLEDYY